MKLNRKVTAMAMAVMMAVSSMPVAFAEETVAETPVVTAEEKAVTWKVQDGSVTFEADGTVTYVLVSTDGQTETKEEKATVVSTQQPTCLVPGGNVYKITILGKDYTSDLLVDETNLPALGHALGEEYTVVDTDPTCEAEGTFHKEKKCTREGCTYSERVANSEGTIAKNEHAVKEYKFARYDDFVNAAWDGNAAHEPVVQDLSQDASYSKVLTGDCSTCKKTVEKKEEVKIPGSMITNQKIEVLDKSESNIVTDITTWTPAEAAEDWKEIELADCTKDGKYDVVSVDSKGNVLSRKTVVVPAHHVEVKSAEAVSKEDASLLDWELDDAGNLVVTNKTCKKEVKYYEVVKCTAAGCKLKDKVVSKSDVKVAAPSDKHSVDATAEATIKNLAKDGFTKDEYKSLVDTYGKSSAVDITTTATCDAKGTTTITMNCVVCGKATDKVISADTDALEHVDRTLGGIVEEKEATCLERGYQVIADKCNICDKEIGKRTTRYIKRLDHTNETGAQMSGALGTTKVVMDETVRIELAGTVLVDNDGALLKKKAGSQVKAAELKGNTIGVTVKVYNNCAVCGENEQDITTVGGKTTTMTLAKAVVKEANRKPGTIAVDVLVKGTDAKGKPAEKKVTLEADYFSNMIAYLDRDTSADKVTDGAAIGEDGKLHYYKDGKIDTTFNGVAKYNGGEFLMAHGTIVEKDGLTQNQGNTKEWYYLSNGQIQKQKSGLAMYDGASFYVVNGKLDTKVTGLVPYNGGTFLFAAGRLVKEKNGLWQDFDGSWYFLALGQVQTQYTGTTTYDGHTFEVVNGKMVKMIK